MIFQSDVNPWLFKEKSQITCCDVTSFVDSNKDRSDSFAYILKTAWAWKKVNTSSWCAYEALSDAVFFITYMTGESVSSL